MNLFWVGLQVALVVQMVVLEGMVPPCPLGHYQSTLAQMLFGYNLKGTLRDILKNTYKAFVIFK